MRHSVGAYTRMSKTVMCGVLLSQIYVDISYCYPSRRWLEEAGQRGVCIAALETFPSAPWLVQFSPLTTRGTLWNRIGPSIKKKKDWHGVTAKTLTKHPCGNYMCLSYLTDGWQCYWTWQSRARCGWCTGKLPHTPLSSLRWCQWPEYLSWASW